MSPVLISRCLCLLLIGTMLPATGFACDTAARDSSRIAVAGGSVAEIIYFLGAEDRIVATDRTSNFPPEAQQFPSLGYVREVSAEGVLSLKPTLVLGEHDMGPEATLDQLRQTSVDVVRVPEEHSAQGVVNKVRCVATVLGLEARAENLIRQDLAASLEAISQRADRPKDRRPKVALVLTFAEGSPMAAGKNTSAQGILDMAGADNVFEFEGWKPVSLEAMVEASPDYLVITERGLNTVGGMEALMAHPAVRFTPAGRNGQILAFDGMALLGFGPRTLDTAVKLAEGLTTMATTSR